MSELKDLAGEHSFRIVPKLDVRHPFDPEASGVVFGLDKTTYLVFEDPSDGYRSHAGPLLSYEGDAYSIGGGWYPEYLNEPVLCSHEMRGQGDFGGENDVLCVRSIKTGQVIFRVATQTIREEIGNGLSEEGR